MTGNPIGDDDDPDASPPGDGPRTPSAVDPVPLTTPGASSEAVPVAVSDSLSDAVTSSNLVSPPPAAAAPGILPRAVDEVPLPLVPPPDVPAFTALCRALGLLGLIGWSLGMFLGTFLVKGSLDRFVTNNAVGVQGRKFLLLVMFGGAVVWQGAGGLYYLLMRKRRDQKGGAAQRLYGVARRLSPLALTGFLPFLFQWRFWQGREMTFLFAATMFSAAGWAAARAALSAPPIFLAGGPRRARWAARLAPLLRPARAALAGTRWPWLPAAVVMIAAVGYTALFTSYTVTYHHNLHTAAYDLGLEDNLVWNVLHGNEFFKSTVFSGPGGSHFGNHATFFSYVIAPFYALSQRAETLLFIQSFLIAAAAIPLFFYARRHLTPWIACLIALCYLLYAPIESANLYEFHYIPLGAVFLWGALYFFEERRDWLAAVAIFLALSVREDIGGAGVAVLGAYLLISGERPRAGLIVAGIGALHFVLLKMVFMPLVSGIESFIVFYKDLFPAGQETFSGVLKTVFGNPFYTLGTLLERDKLFFLLQFFVPLAFIPFGRPMVLLLMVPGFFFTLLSTGYAPLIQASFQYSFLWAVFLFIGLVATLARNPPGVSRLAAAPVSPAQTLRIRAAVFAMLCAMLATSYEFGAIFQQHTVKGGFAVYNFETTARDRVDRAKLEQLIRLIPPRAKVTASDNLVPHISNRPYAYTLRFAVFDADYILFFNEPHRIDGSERGKIADALTSGDFGVVQVSEPFALAKRGYPTDLNDRVLVPWGSRMPAGAHAHP